MASALRRADHIAANLRHDAAQFAPAALDLLVARTRQLRDRILDAFNELGPSNLVPRRLHSPRPPTGRG
jgi:hypothetical protein